MTHLLSRCQFASHACRNKTARGLDRAQELSRHIRIAKQQPPIIMAALLNQLFSAQVNPLPAPSAEVTTWLMCPLWVLRLHTGTPRVSLQILEKADLLKLQIFSQSLQCSLLHLCRKTTELLQAHAMPMPALRWATNTWLITVCWTIIKEDRRDLSRMLLMKHTQSKSHSEHKLP